MSDNFRFAQLQPYSLAGSGAIIGDTSIILKSMTDIDGSALSMSGTFGSIGFGTLEPGNGTLEEQISFTGLVNNSNGTVTLTGVKSVAFVYPYTQTTGLSKTHAGSTTFVISNTSGFYDELTSKSDDESITGTWTFTNPNYPRMDTANPAPTDIVQLVTKGYADSLTFAGAPDASPTQKGIIEVATQTETDAKTVFGGAGAYLTNPLSNQRSTLLSDYVVDTSTSVNVIKIAPSPAVVSYQTGQVFSTKVALTNTSTTPVINVSGLGAKNISLNGTSSPSVGDITAGQMIVVEYDGTNFQMVNPPTNTSPTGSIIMFGGSSAPLGWLICNGSAVSRTTYSALFAVIGVLFGAGDTTTTFNVPHMGGRFVAGPSAFLSSTIGATGGVSSITVGPLNISTTSAAFSGGGGSGIVAFTGTNPTVIASSSASVTTVPPYIITNYLIKT